MNGIFLQRTHRLGWLPVLFAAPLSVGALEAAADTRWRDANEAVGQLQRGHADVLKWEKSQPRPNTEPVAAAPVWTFMTVEQAVRQAWRAHPVLAHGLARLGTSQAAHMAQGDWLNVDPSMARRVEDFAELVEVAAQARKAWTEAVASRHTVRHLRAALDAAEAAESLGARMVQVGNWSKLQYTQVQLAQFQAQTSLKKAQHARAVAHSRLLKTLQLVGTHQQVAVPDELPGLPANAMTGADFQQRLALIHAQLPRASALHGQGVAAVAWDAYQNAWALARSAKDDVLQTQQFITDETVLHYNGMLKSTWELLGAAQNQSQSMVDAIEAQRDFELAQIDLQWVLLGGEPASH